MNGKFGIRKISKIFDMSGGEGEKPRGRKAKAKGKADCDDRRHD